MASYLDPSSLKAQQDFLNKYPNFTSFTVPDTPPGTPLTVEAIEKANNVVAPAPIRLPTTPLPPLLTTTPSGGAPFTFDPLLSPDNILKQGQDAMAAANAPLDINKFVAPQVPLLQKTIQDQLLTNQSSAQSTFGARGLTGSSTELQTLTRDLPAAANQALSEGLVKLTASAYPLAIQEKQGIVDSIYKSASLSTQLRSLLGDEAFKSLNLTQQRELANQDVQLKLTLADIEMQFQASMKQAEFAFTHAENEANRQVARQELEYMKSERNKARQGAFIKSLTGLVGMGIGTYFGGLSPDGFGGQTWSFGKDAIAGGNFGAEAGNAAGGLGQLFLMD